MKMLMLVMLLAVSAAAAPMGGDSEVEIVQPRRVSTSASAGDSSAFWPSSGAGGSRIDWRDLLKAFGLKGGFGSSGSNSGSDSGSGNGFGYGSGSGFGNGFGNGFSSGFGSGFGNIFGGGSGGGSGSGSGSVFGLGFPSFSGRFPVMVTPASSNCDSGRFRLTDEEYEVVSSCQTQGSDADLRQCILDGLENASTDLKEFLSREEFTVTGVSVSASITIINGETEFSRVVTFRMCPRDEVNVVDTSDGTDDVGGVTPEGTIDSDAEAGEDDVTGLFRPVRPTFELPDIFSQKPAFNNFDFESLLRPFLQAGGSGETPSFPSFGNFPGFPDLDMDTEDDNESNCVAKTFNLPKESFKKAKRCRYGDAPFKQCLRDSLEAVEEAKELLQFVEDDGHRIVDTAFYQSLFALNGQIGRKYSVSLERCEKLATDGEATGYDTPAAAGDQAPEPEPESEQENPAVTTPNTMFQNADGDQTEDTFLEP